MSKVIYVDLAELKAALVNDSIKQLVRQLLHDGIVFVPYGHYSRMFTIQEMQDDILSLCESKVPYVCVVGKLPIIRQQIEPANSTFSWRPDIDKHASVNSQIIIPTCVLIKWHVTNILKPQYANVKFAVLSNSSNDIRDMSILSKTHIYAGDVVTNVALHNAQQILIN